jgi:hypothetical protein
LRFSRDHSRYSGKFRQLPIGFISFHGCSIRSSSASIKRVGHCILRGVVKSRLRGHNVILSGIAQRGQTPANFPVRRPFQSHWAFVVNSGKLAYR